MCVCVCVCVCVCMCVCVCVCVCVCMSLQLVLTKSFLSVVIPVHDRNLLNFYPETAAYNFTHVC